MTHDIRHGIYICPTLWSPVARVLFAFQLVIQNRPGGSKFKVVRPTAVGSERAAISGEWGVVPEGGIPPPGEIFK